MKAAEITDALIAELKTGRHRAARVNYANGDMVGHTGVFDAAVKACETLDRCIGRLADAVRESGGEMIITADHGNVEQMFDTETNQPHSAHTCELVPFVYVGPRRNVRIAEGGVLSDVAPTLLALIASSFHLMAAGRAYTEGESLWSKGQKDAVQFLARYHESCDEADFTRYRQAIAVPLGDRQARRAMLQQPEPDRAAARAGFLQGPDGPVALLLAAHVTAAEIADRLDAAVAEVAEAATDDVLVFLLSKSDDLAAFAATARTVKRVVNERMEPFVEPSEFVPTTR